MHARGRSSADIERHVPWNLAVKPHTGGGKSIPLSLGLLWPRCPAYYSRHSDAAPMARRVLRYASMARRGIMSQGLTSAGADAILFTTTALDIVEDDVRADAIRESRPDNP